MSKRPNKPSLRDRLGHDRLFQTSADLPRIVELDTDAILANPEQPRTTIDGDELDELKLSIEQHGLLQPILVKEHDGTGWMLVAGQRRLAAFRSLGRSTIPAIIVGGDAGELALVENLQRQDLDPFDEAAAVARLMERHGYDQAGVGAIIGKRQNTISALLAINKLPDAIRNDRSQANMAVSRSVLVELAQIPDETLQHRLWERAKTNALTVRDLRLERKRTSLAPSRRVSPPDLGRKLERFISTGQVVLEEFERDSVQAPLTADMLSKLQTLHRALGQLLDKSADQENQALYPTSDMESLSQQRQDDG